MSGPDTAKPLTKRTEVDFRNHANAKARAPFRAVIYPPTDKRPQHRIRYWVRDEPYRETRRGRTWGEVINWLEIQRQAAAAATVGPVRIQTLSDAVDAYLETLVGHSANYRKAESSYLRSLTARAGKVALPVLKPGDIQPVFSGRSRYTATRIRASLSRCLEHARRQQAIDRARADWVTDGLVLPAAESSHAAETFYPEELPSRKQLQAVSKVLDEPYRLLWWVTAGCYLRPSEAVALCPEQVLGEWLRIDRALVTVSPPPGEEPYSSDPGLPEPQARNLVMKRPKSRAGLRDVKVPTSVAGYPVRKRLVARARKLPAGQPLFPTPRGAWWDLGNLAERVFKPATATVEGWEWQPFQILRHWGISTLVNTPGVRLIDVSRSAGHSSSRVTQDKYLRRRKDEDSTPDAW